MRSSRLISALSAATTHVSAVRLYSAHSDGNVTALSLTGTAGGSSSSNGSSYTLAVSSVTADCEANPAVLTLDKANRVLYCYDRGGSKDTIGSLNSFSIDDAQEGALTRISRIEAPYSGVWGEILTVDEASGERVYVSASYNASAVGVFSLASAASSNGSSVGALTGTGPIQTILPTIETPGPVAGRQDRSYLHHVIIDPTNKFVVTPDLGGDRVRVYTYNSTGFLAEDEASALTTDPGVGPRHGFFRVNDADETFFFFNGEISQKVYSYKVTYADNGGLSFEKVFEATALGENSTFAAGTAPTSECAMTPDGRFLIISHREKSFKDSSIYQSGPSDTLSTWTINEDGTLSFLQNVPSGGWSPRQFSLNAAGDMIAVGHQNNKTVVIWKRDVESGLILTEEQGGKVGEVLLTGSVVSTIWDE